jgi:hypothetical protein
LLALPVLAFGTCRAVRVPEALQLGQVHALGYAGVVRRVQLTEPGRAGAGGRVAHGLTDGVGAALVEVDAGVEAGAVDAGGVLGAVVVKVAAVFALPVLADLAERAVGVSPAAGEADAVSAAVLRLLAELSGQAVGVVEADLDAGPVDAAFAERTLDVDVATGQAVVPDADGAFGTQLVAVGAADGRPDASVSRIRNSVARDSAKSGGAFADGIDAVGGLADGVGSACVGERTRVIADVGVNVNCRKWRHEKRLCGGFVTVELRRRLSRRSRRSDGRAKSTFCRRSRRRLCRFFQLFVIVRVGIELGDEFVVVVDVFAFDVLVVDAVDVVFCRRNCRHARGSGRPCRSERFPSSASSKKRVILFFHF